MVNVTKLVKISKNYMEFDKQDIAWNALTVSIFREDEVTINIEDKPYQFILTNKHSDKVYFRQDALGNYYIVD